MFANLIRGSSFACDGYVICSASRVITYPPNFTESFRFVLCMILRFACYSNRCKGIRESIDTLSMRGITHAWLHKLYNLRKPQTFRPRSFFHIQFYARCRPGFSIVGDRVFIQNSLRIKLKTVINKHTRLNKIIRDTNKASLALSTRVDKARHTRVMHRTKECINTCVRTNEHIDTSFPTCLIMSNTALQHTRANPHVWYNTLHTRIPMPCVQIQSESLLHLHHTCIGCMCTSQTYLHSHAQIDFVPPPPKLM